MFSNAMPNRPGQQQQEPDYNAGQYPMHPQTYYEYQQEAPIVISRNKKNIHMLSEGFALLAVVPFMGWLATSDRVKLPGWAKTAAGGLALGTLLVDGGLLLSYALNGKGKRLPPPQAYYPPQQQPPPNGYNRPY